MIFVLLPALASATTFNVTLTTSDGHFPGKAAAPFGNTAGPLDIDLTPDVPVSLPINRFTNFFPNDVFPPRDRREHHHHPDPHRRRRLDERGPDPALVQQPGGCPLVQQLSPVTLTVDLGVKGKVTLTLANPPTIAVPWNGQPSNPIVVIPGTSVPIAAAVLDDFVFYKVNTSKGAPKLAAFGPVQLDNILDFAAYDLTGIAGLGLPAGKNGAATFDGATHLASYTFKRRKGSGKFFKLADTEIQTACGNLLVTLVKPDTVLVPVLNDPLLAPDPMTSQVDHFVCYQAKLAKSTIAQNACGPLVPRDKGTKLVPPQAKHVKQLAVPITGQLGSATLDTAKELEVCVPQPVELPLV